MRFYKLILFLFLCSYIKIYSQQINIEVPSKKELLTQLLADFKSQHQFSFSYDVNAIKDISIVLQKEAISIASLQQIIEQQTSYLLEKVDQTNYILIKNNKLISICGVIIDATSKFELPQTEILSNNKIIDITDNKGAFEIQLHPSDSINIAYLGYQRKTFRASEFPKKSCDTIQLFPEIEALEQVLVKEYLTGGISKNQDASVNISTKKLRILPGLAEPDVLQSLQLLPGISSPTEDPAGLYIRGGTPDQNLVLWDGIKMYQNGHFFDQISTFNPYITKNVQVYRGGTSVRYGDRISGVIVIESDDDLTEKIKAGGGINFTHGDLFIKLPLSKKLGIMIAGRRSTTDLYQNITYNNLLQKVFQNTRADLTSSLGEQSLEEKKRNDYYSFFDSNVKILWTPNKKNTIKLSSIFTKNKLDNDLSIVDQDNTVSIKDIIKTNNGGLGLNWKKIYNNKLKQNVNIYYSSYKQKSSYLQKENIENNDLFSNSVEDKGIEYILDMDFSKKNAIGIGYQFTNIKTTYENTYFTLGISGIRELKERIEANGNNHTFFSEYRYKTNKTFINLGLRGSYLTNVGDFFIEPRLFASHKLSNRVTINTSAELKNQQLNKFVISNGILNNIQTQVLPTSDNFWLLSNFKAGNENISFKVVKSIQFTLGALYSYEGWNIDIEGYYKKLNNLTLMNNDIISLDENEDGSDMISYGEEKRIGVDILLKKRIKNYRFWIGYSLSRTVNFYAPLKTPKFKGNFDQPHVLSISQTLKIKNLELALGWNYATGNVYSNVIQDPEDSFQLIIDEKGINNNRFKDYHRLDLSTTYRFKLSKEKKSNILFGISIRNLYGRKNSINRNYRDYSQDFDRTLESFDYKSIGFTPDLVFRFNF